MLRRLDLEIQRALVIARAGFSRNYLSNKSKNNVSKVPELGLGVTGPKKLVQF